MNISKLFCLSFIVLFLSGCSEPPGIMANADGYTKVDVYYATDRKETTSSFGDSEFGSDRGTMSYGASQISIPREHKMGELEEPSIFKFEFREDPKKHVVLLNLKKLEASSYFKTIQERVNSSEDKSALIFVHGYNVSFEDAARRTGQITYDLNFGGVPVFYSWPSNGKTAKYTDDEADIQWSQHNIENFLLDFASKSDAENIYLIAHSMGNRGVTRAYISAIQKRPEIASRFKEIILAAPDIDADVFKEQIAPEMIRAGRPITLYASSEDVALKASKFIHGEPRAGDSGENLTIMAGIETIDATNVKTSFLGHSYFADNRSVISDIFYIFEPGLRADQRAGLDAKILPEGKYWKFRD